MVKIASPQMYARPYKVKPNFERRSEIKYCNKEHKAHLADILNDDLIILFNHNTSENEPDTICMYDATIPMNLDNPL